MRTNSATRRRRSPGLRLRPGERPRWWTATADRPHFEHWRTAAATAAVSVDALVAALVELDFVREDLDGVVVDPIAFLSVACDDAPGLAMIGVGAGLAAWLDARDDAGGADELPDVLLPERLAVRIPPGAPLHSRLAFDLTALALACDRCAAAQGRTLESWALRAAAHATRRGVRAAL